MAHPFLRKLGKLVLVGLGLILLTVGYAVYAEHAAKSRAQDFCSALSVGASAEPLLETAKSKGADARHSRWIQRDGADRWLPVTFVGLAPFSRHICSVDATDAIKSFKYVYLD